VIAALNSQAFVSGPYIGHPTTGDRVKSNAGHRQIFDALMAGDGGAAEAAMSDHIHQSWLRRRPPGPDTSARP
jgi:DNA-binding GntR family transcriptional regulator